MLRPDPAQQHRLQEIITNLIARSYEATERGWLGEAEGLDASLAAAQHKLEQMRRMRRRQRCWQARSSPA